MSNQRNAFYEQLFLFLRGGVNKGNFSQLVHFVSVLYAHITLFRPAAHEGCSFAADPYDPKELDIVLPWRTISLCSPVWLQYACDDLLIDRPTLPFAHSEFQAFQHLALLWHAHVITEFWLTSLVAILNWGPVFGIQLCFLCLLSTFRKSKY